MQYVYLSTYLLNMLFLLSLVAEPSECWKTERRPVSRKFAFYPRDVVSAVYAIRRRGWLSGWVAGCPSHAGIVSKRLNLS